MKTDDDIIQSLVPAVALHSQPSAGLSGPVMPSGVCVCVCSRLAEHTAAESFLRVKALFPVECVYIYIYIVVQVVGPL